VRENISAVTGVNNEFETFGYSTADMLAHCMTQAGWWTRGGHPFWHYSLMRRKTSRTVAFYQHEVIAPAMLPDRVLQRGIDAGEFCPLI
jgi:hypothetical protein